MPSLQIVDVERSDLDQVVDVYADAFRDYAVMRYVLEGHRAGDSASRGHGRPGIKRDAEHGVEYERRLRRLVRLFTETRYVRGGLVWKLIAGGEVVAAANVDLPEATAGEEELAQLREEAWGELGADARSRYADYGEVSATFQWPEPHFHLGMIGVRKVHRGRGYARPLLEALHRLSDRSPTSRGCSLTTEARQNLALYEHFGYRVIGHGASGGLASWGLFRDSVDAAS